MDKKEATKLIAEKVAAAQALITEAEAVADAAGVSFELSIGGYGMGGSYMGENNEWKESAGWRASSQSC